MPVRVTSCGVMPPPISTLTSAAVLAAASQPSMSSDGIGFRDAARLHLGDRIVEAHAAFELATARSCRSC